MADEIGAPQEDSSKSMPTPATPTIKTETETVVPPLTSSSDCDSAAAAEQRNSPSTTVTSQEYQQQLHEAIMAFDSHGLSQNLMAAMAAAVGVSSPSSSTLQQVPHHPELSNHQGSLPPPPAPPRKDIDLAKRESIRTANRERKKKWRIHNEERSKSRRRQQPLCWSTTHTFILLSIDKDNDLRCRVNKRASKLFGSEYSEGKRLWAEDEFRKRREKRQEKERRKDVVNNVLSAPHTTSAQPPASSAPHTMLSQQAAIDDLAQSFAAYPSVFDASKLLEIPSDLQRHLLEQLNLALTNSKLPASLDYGQPSSDVAGAITGQADPSNLHTGSDSSHNTAAEVAAAAAAELLAATASTISTPLISSTVSLSPPPALVQSSPSTLTTMELDDPVTSPSNNNNTMEVDEKDDANSSDGSTHSLESTVETTNDDASTTAGDGQDVKNQKPEYPMDAVLTLMQLNADGIWHTSVVVYGQEFYFGQGILVDKPGTTHHGQPLEVIDMGTTFLPLEVFLEYIDSQRSVYTNDVCQFLTGSSIPNHITDLPAEFLRTPFGQSILPMIENMFGQSNLRPSTATNGPSAQAPPNAESVAMLQGISSSALSGAPASISQQSVQKIDNVTSLDKLITTYPAVAVFFTSATCPPCRVIKPDFEQLIKDKNQDTPSLRILGAIVDTSVAFDAGAKYQVRSTPTFMFFHNGQKMSQFSGADYAELKSSIDLLLFTAYPRMSKKNCSS
ncbi:hypothetical protein [Absidia glauca]|uniref:Thioredoxin domain-containing protein n=1 Tax=Absidia glauca TaxID=4829 RepID=A0A168PY73_ABSGL|nr:hypothetical protein [Absidia glauca]